MGKMLNILILFLISAAFFVGFGGWSNDLASVYGVNQTNFSTFDSVDRITDRLDDISQTFEDNKDKQATLADYIWGAPLFLLNAAYNGIMILFDLPNVFMDITGASSVLVAFIPPEIVSIVNFMFIAVILGSVIYLIIGKVF